MIASPGNHAIINMHASYLSVFKNQNYILTWYSHGEHLKLYISLTSGKKESESIDGNIKISPRILSDENP